MTDTPPGGLDLEQETCDQNVPTTNVLAPQAGELNRDNRRKSTPAETLLLLTIIYIILICIEPLWLLALPVYLFCTYAILRGIAADRTENEQTPQQLQIQRQFELNGARIREDLRFRDIDL